jgi:precorrin-2 dehydrogenase/sirohydrochlorin ferrochelatase
MASTSTSKSWPTIEPGGSLIVALQLRSQPILIVGGGSVAADRLRAVLTASTKPSSITLVSPRHRLCPEVSFRLFDENWGVVYQNRDFVESDLDGQWLVLTAIDDPAVSRRIYGLCRERRILVNVADVPPECDFFFGSVIRRGPLQVMVSTQGKGPRVAARIRRMIDDALPANVGAAIESVGELRKGLRKLAPGHNESRRRMEWMVRVCDRWTIDQLAYMDDSMRSKVLEGWQTDEARGWDDVRQASSPLRLSWLRAVDWWNGVSSRGTCVLSCGAGVGVGLAFGLLLARRSPFH